MVGGAGGGEVMDIIIPPREMDRVWTRGYGGRVCEGGNEEVNPFQGSCSRRMWGYGTPARPEWSVGEV